MPPSTSPAHRCSERSAICAKPRMDFPGVDLLASPPMADSKEPKRPPLQPLPEAMEELKAASVPFWKMANEHLQIVETIWEEGGTILDALGHVSPNMSGFNCPAAFTPPRKPVTAAAISGISSRWNCWKGSSSAPIAANRRRKRTNAACDRGHWPADCRPWPENTSPASSLPPVSVHTPNAVRADCRQTAPDGSSYSR